MAYRSFEHFLLEKGYTFNVHPSICPHFHEEQYLIYKQWRTRIGKEKFESELPWHKFEGCDQCIYEQAEAVRLPHYYDIRNIRIFKLTTTKVKHGYEELFEPGKYIGSEYDSDCEDQLLGVFDDTDY